MAVPVLTAQQRTDALAKAAAARQARAQVREDLKAGKVTLASVLQRGREDEVIGKLRVEALLESLPGVGKVKARRIMAEVAIAQNRRVRGLGVHQVEGLLAHTGSR